MKPRVIIGKAAGAAGDDELTVREHPGTKDVEGYLKARQRFVNLLYSDTVMECVTSLLRKLGKYCNSEA